MEKAHQRIKPLFPPIIHIKSFYTFRNLFIRRPKQTDAFKFTRQNDIIGKDQAKIKLKLQKAFRFLKSIKRVDLHQFQRKSRNHQRLISYFKRFSKASTTLLAKRYSSEKQLASAKKSAKYLCGVSTLNIESGDKRWTDPLFNDNPLRDLKYHPKIQSLRYLAPWRGFHFVKTGQKNLRFLKQLVILAMPEKASGLNFFFFERLVNLESVHLRFCGGDNADPDVILQSLDGLSQLSKLENLFLEFERKTFAGIPSELKKIAERKILKRLCLIFRYVFIDGDVLQVLENFDQLTHLELRISLDKDDEALLEVLSASLERMKQLEDLKLIVQKKLGFESLDIIYKEINNLESLRHIFLDFDPVNQAGSLALLQNLFTKSIKLQSLYLSSYKITSHGVLLDLVTALESSLTSLQKLKIGFVEFSPDQQSQELIIKLLENLCNIQVLELFGLEIYSEYFLNQITQAISLLKSLRELHIQEIGGEVTKHEFMAAINMITQKRGLVKFEYKASAQLSINPLKRFVNPFAYLEGDWYYSNPFVRELHQKNPDFEKIKITQGRL